MSWEFYASCYREGEPKGFPKQDLISIGKRNSFEREGPGEYLIDFLYDDGYLDLKLIEEKSDTLDGFCVWGSFGATAMDRVVEMAATFHCALYWGADDGMPWVVIPFEEMLSCLPSALKNAEPAPVVVTNGYELASAINPATDRNTHYCTARWLSDPVTPLMNTRGPSGR